MITNNIKYKYNKIMKVKTSSFMPIGRKKEQHFQNSTSTNYNSIFKIQLC